jgi:virginiamycin B lyase
MKFGGASWSLMPALSLAQQVAVGAYAFVTPPDGFVPGITIGPDGALWFTQLSGGQVGHITTAGTITQYGAGSGSAIVAGPDGALWFTRYSSDTGNIGRITTSGSFTGYPVPGAYFLDGITVGPDGALWFTDQDVNTIGRITTT